MKVVLFCGGYGMRMRNSPVDDVPKPMQMVGPRPLIWHVMRYYAHYGHKEFILCLGYYITPALVGGPKDQMVSNFISIYINRELNWGLAAARRRRCHEHDQAGAAARPDVRSGYRRSMTSQEQH